MSRALERHNVAVLIGGAGTGRSTIVRDLHGTAGGRVLGAHDFMVAMEGRHPLALEEAFFDLVGTELDADDTVLIDDFHLIANVSCCGGFYPRQNFLLAPLVALGELAKHSGRRLLLSADALGMHLPWTRDHFVRMGDFTSADYRAVCSAYLDADDLEAIDFAQVYRFARHLSAAQLRSSCLALRATGGRVDTEAVVDHLRAWQLVANVDIREVQEVDLRDLKGLDNVIEALEGNVVLPLENAELAAELSLKPKRGVLLAGPPGTGKTTVGRALAHRLRSKFFLIDGTVIAGTGAFFHRVQQIFEAAKQNAPAIIFIDDADVLFEGGGDAGFYRYLLTMLDGIESESAGRVCLVMTAMDVGSLPAALVRSGRIELCLETRLPDEAARAAILADRCAELPRSMGEVDIPALAGATEELSGADLRRLVDDGKMLYAHDKARGRPLRPLSEYFLAAVDVVRENKMKYAEAEARARMRQAQQPHASGLGAEGQHVVHMMHAMAASGSGGFASFGGNSVGMSHAISIGESVE